MQRGHGRGSDARLPLRPGERGRRSCSITQPALCSTASGVWRPQDPRCSRRVQRGCARRPGQVPGARGAVAGRRRRRARAQASVEINTGVLVGRLWLSRLASRSRRGFRPLAHRRRPPPFSPPHPPPPNPPSTTTTTTSAMPGTMLSGGFYKYRCKYFLTHNCPNWVRVAKAPCAMCMVRDLPAAGKLPAPPNPRCRGPGARAPQAPRR